MEKKTIITISLVVTILSLIYTLLSYYGLLRYMGLYTWSIEGYLNEYKNLDKVGKNRTVISISVTPTELKNLTPVVKSLIDQTVKVDLVSVIVPYGSQYVIPKQLENVVVVFRCGEDRGLLNCLIPAITREGDANTKIVTLRGDKIYGKDFIEELLETSEKYPDKIVYENGKSDKISIERGVVFSTNFFDEKFVNPPKGVDPNTWVNDYFKDFPKQKISYSGNYRSL